MLTTLATVKARLGLKADDTVDDAILNNAIDAASGRFDLECNRVFARTIDATFVFDANQRELAPRYYPIETVSAWHVKTMEAEGWVEQTGVDFLIRSGGDVPCVLSLPGPLGSCNQLARVTFTGGYVLPGDATDYSALDPRPATLPGSVEQACVEQVAYWYQNRNRLGVVSASAEGGSISQFSQLDLLPSVKAILKSMRRFNL